MASLLYAEVNIICLLISLLILYKIKTGVGMQAGQCLYTHVLVTNIILVLLDFIWILLNGNCIQSLRQINYLVNIAYLIATGFSGYLWFLYSESIITSGSMKRKWKLIGAIPVLVLIALIICSYWTGWIFYIDSKNIYHRGVLHFMQLLTAFEYLVVVVIHTSIYALRKENVVYRKRFITISSFIIIPLIAGMIQTMIPGLPCVCVGITGSLLWLFLDSQEQLISIDPLTQLNNRNQLIKFLSGKLNHQDENTKLYALMMDIDYFKSINDKYGHVEGDVALGLVADTLKRTCKRHNCFICRYGGDEFIVICESKSEQEVTELCNEIKSAIAQVNTGSKGYQLSLCIGYAENSKENTSITDLIKHADKRLYSEKKHRSKDR